MSNPASAALVNPWKDLWNGHLGVADEIIAEDFVAHAAPLTGTGTDEIHGRETLKAWISGIHAVLADLTFVEVTFTGSETPRVVGGKLAEYWANADSLLFFQQLGVRDVPVG